MPALWELLRPRPQLPGCSAPPLGQAGLRVLGSAVVLGVAGWVPALRQEAGQVVGGAQPPRGAVARSRMCAPAQLTCPGSGGAGRLLGGGLQREAGAGAHVPGRPVGLSRQCGGCRQVLLSPELRAQSSLNPLSQRGPAVSAPTGRQGLDAEGAGHLGDTADPSSVTLARGQRASGARWLRGVQQRWGRAESLSVSREAAVRLEGGEGLVGLGGPCQ